MLKKTWFLLSMVFSVHAQVHINVELATPSKLPDQTIYLATDFNNWDPGDNKFALKKLNDKKYYIELKNTPKQFKYKFTQGSWMNVEGTPDGRQLPDRVCNVSDSIISTKILGWEKLISYEITVENLPENTPEDCQIFIAGNFNNWNPGQKAYQLQKFSQGGYRVLISSDLPRLEYKFTRGSWKSVEARPSGKSRPNRMILRSKSINNKDIRHNIEGWEDLMGTVHVYSLLDFLLMFSVFQCVLLLIAIPLLPSVNLSANRWLLLLLAINALAVLFYLQSNFQVFVNARPWVVLVSDFVYFLYGPIFYFYLKKLLFNVQSFTGNWYWQFVPFLIQFFVYLPFLLQNDKAFLLSLMNQQPTIIYTMGGMGFLGLVWNIYYWNLYRKTIKTYQEAIRGNQSFDPNLDFVMAVLVVQLLVICFWAFALAGMVLNKYFNIDNLMIVENSVDFTWLAFSIIPYFVGYYALQHAQPFKATPSQISIFDDILDSATPALINQPKIIDQHQKEIALLEQHLRVHKPYTNSKISLYELADQINIQPHLLSKIINDGFHQNFFDFINTYRVQEFQRLVSEPQNQHSTFLSLAFEVGFNSKTAFNRAFKKLTNLTPKEYIESQK